MKNLQTLDDSELIERVIEGEEKAFTVLVYRYEKDLRQEILHYVRDRSVHEDLSQEILIKIYTSLKAGRYTDQGKFGAWALRIARNYCLDFLRKTSRRPKAIYEMDEDDVHSSHAVNAETRMCDMERNTKMHAWINSLPVEQKMVVVYRYFGDATFKEIASLTNCNVNTTMGRMRYSLARLRKQIRSTPAFVWR